MLIAYKGTVEKDSMTGDGRFWRPRARGMERGASPGDCDRKQFLAASDRERRGRRRGSRHQRRLELQRGDRGRFRYPTMTFKQDGKNLSGTYEGQLGKADLKGTLEGSDIRFSFKVDVQGQQLEVTYAGKVEGKDSMKGTVKLGEFAEGTWTASRKP